MADLDMLKAVVDQYAIDLDRWDASDDAVNNVLRVLQNASPTATWFTPVYEAIKAAYVGDADWGDE